MITKKISNLFPLTHLLKLFFLSEGRQQRRYKSVSSLVCSQIPSIIIRKKNLTNVFLQISKKILHHVVFKQKFENDDKENLPVFVETTTAFFGQMLSPDINQGTKTEGSFNVTNSTNHNHGWGFQNGYGFNDLLLVHLCKNLVKEIN